MVVHALVWPWTPQKGGQRAVSSSPQNGGGGLTVTYASALSHGLTLADVGFFGGHDLDLGFVIARAH